MYKLMIVDDEPEIRAHMKSMIQWDKLNVILVAEAGDSDTALENYFVFHPQIVIMDICLTGMDGISLTQELMQQDPSVKVVIVSSYQDFSYAQKALSMGVSNYLTKPIVAEELNESLQRIVEEMAEKKRESQRIFAAKQVVEKNREILQQWILEEVINGEFADTPEQIGQQLALLNMDLQDKKCAVAMISVITNDTVMHDGGFQLATIKQYIDTKLGNEGYQVYSYFDDEKNLICMVSRTDACSNEEFEKVFLTINNEVDYLLGMTIRVGLGLFTDNVKGISLSAEQAELAWQNANILSGEPVISFWNLKSIQPAVNNHHVLNNKRYLTMLLDYIRNGKREELVSMIHIIMDQLSTENQRRSFALDLLSGVSKLCVETGIDPWKLIDYPVTVKQLFSSESITDFGGLVLSLCDKLNDSVKQKNYDTNSHLARKAKVYIDENYWDKNLSLEQVSDHVGLSKAYFCSLFHRVEGVTFKSYLMDVRIQHAKRMLISTDKKIYEISCEVGCADSAYFNRLFKRVTGFTPLQYRNSGRK